MAELSLWLDSYDDIFSDFDSRHYLKRRISEDFIEELQMSLKYRHEQPDSLILLLPEAQRNAEVEKEISVSIKEQLRDRIEILQNKSGKTRMRGTALLVSGMLIMLLDSLIVWKIQSHYPGVVLRIVMEPAGWFMIWNGLDYLVYEYRSIKKETAFYKTIERLGLHFKNV